jgi:Rad3-related DNA helicase
VDLNEELRQLENQDLDVKTNREFKSLANIHQRLSAILASLQTTDGTPWVYTGRDGNPAWKPTVVDQLGDSLLWRHGEKWLLMSGTVISAETLLGGLGYHGPYRLITSRSTFPVENRQVIVNGVANMAYSQQRKDWKALADNVASVIARHPGENVLVHTVSYDLAGYLQGILQRRASTRTVISYTSAAEATRALSDYRLGGGNVLLAPSMDRGIDLPGNACRVQIIAKVPFPSLNDRQIKARLYGTGQAGKTWYLVETVRTIVQMSMRAVRHKEDQATTYILDSQFSQGVWYRGRNLFPSWWREAVRWERNA